MLKLFFPVKDNDPNQFRYIEENLSEFASSIKRHQKRLKELHGEEDVGHEKVTILSHVGLAYFKLESYTLSKSYFEDLLSIAQDLGDRRTQGQAYTNLGCLHSRSGNLTEALECFEKSVMLARDRDDQRSIAKNLNNLGNIYQLQSNIAGALECHEERLEISRELVDLDGICKAYGSLGALYRANGQLKESIERYEELLNTLRTKLRIQIVLADDDSESDDDVDLDEIGYDIMREQMDLLNKKKEDPKPTFTQKMQKKCSDIGFLMKSLVKQ